ncbi:MAG: hypothetical protein H6840_08190 [Planctomycetes bacterium]|nr:hypothetical protein [Planctomycetota bacterium]
MKLHVIAVLAACLFAHTLSAQAVLNLDDVLFKDTELEQMFTVDFGSTAQGIQLDLSVSAKSGGYGIAVSLIDLDELAANGVIGTIVSGSDPGTGTVNISLTTAAYSGVVEFMLTARPFSNGYTEFTGTLSCTGLPTGAITAGAKGYGTWPGYGLSQAFMFRGVQLATDNAAAASPYEIDFGSVAQSVTFNAHLWGTGDATAEVFEVDDQGAQTLLTTLTVTGTGSDDSNPTTSSRSGIVTFYYKITTSTSSAFQLRCIFPSGTSMHYWQSRGPAGGSGPCDTCGCAVGSSSRSLVVFLSALAAFCAALRLRKRLA